MSNARHKQFLEKSKKAALSAIELYNKPNFDYREESFVILMVNSWELLFKAKILKENKENLKSLYVPIRTSKIDGTKYKRKSYKKNRAGNFMTYDILYMINNSDIDKNLKTNLETLIELRDNSIHFINSTKLFEKELLQVATASLKNYSVLIKEWFGKSLEDINLYLIPIAFNLPRNFSVENLKKETDFHKNLLHYIQIQREKNIEDSKYDVCLNIDIKFNKKSTDASEIKFGKDGVPIYIDSEDAFKAKYPWTFEDLKRNLKETYLNFSSNTNFFKIKKELEKREDLAKDRLFDYKNPKGMKKKYYSPNILKEFDKIYKRK